MIFTAIDPDISFEYLKEANSHWLLRKSKEKDKLAFDYIGNSGPKTILLEQNEKGEWTILSRTIAAEANPLPLINCLKEIITYLYSKALINWNWSSCVVYIPEKSEQALPELINDEDYTAAYITEKEQLAPTNKTAAAIFYEPTNWIHKVALKTCLSDQRLYPSIKLLGCASVIRAANNKTTTEIRSELAKLLERKTPNLESALLKNPYYENIKEAFDHRIKTILEELAIKKITEKNSESATTYNKKEKGKTRIYPEQDKKTLIENELIHFSAKSIAYIANCSGDKEFQEDRACAITNIKLEASWQNRIPELLIYTIQTLVAEIYEKYPTECSDQCIGSTLTAAFTYNNKVYIAWLGDSPIIRFESDGVNTEARYLYWPHKATAEQEHERIKSEHGFIENNRVNKFLIVSRAIGDRSYSKGKGISDIPSIMIEDLTCSDKAITLLLCSDGLTDGLSLNELIAIFKKTKIEDFASTCCNLSYRKNPTTKADNITAMVLPNCPNNTFAYVLDGHGLEKGYLVAEYAEKNLHKHFKHLAENKAPPIIAIPDLSTTMTNTSISSMQEPTNVKRKLWDSAELVALLDDESVASVDEKTITSKKAKTQFFIKPTASSSNINNIIPEPDDSKDKIQSYATELRKT